MCIVAFITTRAVIDRILDHVRRTRERARGPPRRIAEERPAASPPTINPLDDTTSRHDVQLSRGRAGGASASPAPPGRRETQPSRPVRQPVLGGRRLAPQVRLAPWRATEILSRSIALIEQLWPNVTRALKWIDTFGDADRDGFLEYGRRNPTGLNNRGGRILTTESSTGMGPSRSDGLRWPKCRPMCSRRRRGRQRLPTQGRHVHLPGRSRRSRSQGLNEV